MNAQQFQDVLSAAIHSARGNYGTGAAARTGTQQIYEAQKNHRKYIKEHRQRGKKIRMMDGSTGYGRYRRVRRGRGQYATGFFSGMAKTIGKNILGLGKYKRRVRRGRGAYGDTQTQDVPIFANPQADDGPVTVRNKEYLGQVTASSQFSIQNRMAINPGNRSTFPWLSQIAANFSQYRFEGLSFHFVSTSGNITTTQALGEILMAVDYNPVGQEITTKAQMLATPFASSKAPCADSECPVECAPQQMMNGGLLYIRDSVPANQDLRFYDLGEFVLASNGQSSTVNGQVLGELWVTYQCALYKPQLAEMEEGSTAVTGTSSVFGKWQAIPGMWNNEHYFGTNWQWQNYSAITANAYPVQTMQAFGLAAHDMLAIQNMSPGESYMLQITWDAGAAGTAATITWGPISYQSPYDASATATNQYLFYDALDTTTPTYLFWDSQPAQGASTKSVTLCCAFQALQSTVYLTLGPGNTLPVQGGTHSNGFMEIQVIRVRQ